MKKILLLMVLSWTSLFYFTESKAQCTVSELKIELISAVPQGDSCLVTFNFSWKQEANHGNKFAYVHLWNTSEYPDLLANGLAYFPPSNAPDATDLADALATIVIHESGSVHPFLGGIYLPDPTVSVLQPNPNGGLDIAKIPIDATSDRMVVQNITLVVPDCDSSGITGDIWSTQANNGQTVHCVSTGITLVVGNPRITGLLNCTIPRQFNVEIRNIGPSPITVSYDVHIDLDADGLFEPTTHDTLIIDNHVASITLNPGESYFSGFVPYVTADSNINKGLWVEVQTEGYINTTFAYIGNNCAALPVTLSLFTARRDGSMVLIQWQTLTEENSMGFEIQRKTANGDWVNVTFIASKAVNGNSTSPLNYTYQDLNPAKGISEYRLKQIDFDREFRYSEIRAVRGLDQEADVMIYPNPSSNGEMNILINDGDSFYDVSLLDMRGRILKQWNNYRQGHIRINDLEAGVYAVRLANTETREVKSYKFVVVSR